MIVRSLEARIPSLNIRLAAGCISYSYGDAEKREYRNRFIIEFYREGVMIAKSNYSEEAIKDSDFMKMVIFYGEEYLYTIGHSGLVFRDLSGNKLELDTPVDGLEI